MNLPKLLFGILIVFLALFLQLWLPIAGLHPDFVLAALIALAFLFPFLELVLFILLAVFALNWQPTLGIEILVFALIPVAAYVLRLWLTWETWIGVAISIAAGIFVFYGLTAPNMVLSNIGVLVVDALVCVAFGEIIIWGAGS